MALRTTPSGRTYRDGRIADTVEERGGSTPFNLLPVAAGGLPQRATGIRRRLPYDVAAWWVKYLLPPGRRPARLLLRLRDDACRRSGLRGVEGDRH